MFFLERQRYWTTTALNTSILFDTAHRVHNFILKKDEYTTIIGLQIILFMFIDKHENRKTTIKKFFLLSVKELFIAFAYHVKVTGFQASCGEYFNFFLIKLRDEYLAVLTSCKSRAQMYESSYLLSPFKLLKITIIIMSWLRLFAVFRRVEFARETNVIICLMYFIVWVLTLYV